MQKKNEPSTPRDSLNKSARHGGGGWARSFGYDIFISFALGDYPRGTRGYASDLARKLRERGFTVFFSEDEAPVGNQLDNTLRRAIRRSRMLVVIANQETLREPRYVRREVEEFSQHRPKSPVAVINIDNALPVGENADVDKVSAWLPFHNRIWVNESRAAWLENNVSDEVTERLITTPISIRSVTRLRYTVSAIVATFAVVAVLAMVQRSEAVNQRNRAQEALLSSAAKQAMLQSQNGQARAGWETLVAALKEVQPEVNGPLPDGFLTAALTTLIENRLGPALAFDETMTPASQADSFNSSPPLIAAFDSSSRYVAASSGNIIAVWTTQDGQRLSQTRLAIIPDTLTFAAQGKVLIVEGKEPEKVTEQAEAPSPPPRAFAIDILSGKLTELPLGLCQQIIPCIATSRSPEALRPLIDFPEAGLEKEPGNHLGYIVKAADNVTLVGQAFNRYLILNQREPRQGGETFLFDLKNNSKTILDNHISEMTGAMDAPVFVRSSYIDPEIIVYKAQGSNKKGEPPALIKIKKMKARNSAGIKNMSLSADGSTLRYQNNRWGTGEGHGLERTVLLNLENGKEIWARDDNFGDIVWSNNIAAVPVVDGNTHLFSAATGTSWFTSPDTPLVFAPNDIMLLTQTPMDLGSHTWPELHLLETLPVFRFSRGLQPASIRGVCNPFPDFMTLPQRFDRLWNREDWHIAPGESLSTLRFQAPENTFTTYTLTPEGDKWTIEADDEPATEEDQPLPQFTKAQLQQRYPLFADLITGDEYLQIKQTVSPDGKWTGLIILNQQNDKGQRRDKSCDGIATWSLYRTEGRKLINKGCTTESAEVNAFTLAITFSTRAQKDTLAMIPVDSCHYQVMNPENASVITDITPIYSNDVSFSEENKGTIGVTSSDWYGATVAYQVQDLTLKVPGPVFELALQNISTDSDTEHDTSSAVNIEKVVFNPLYREIPNPPAVEAEAEAEADDRRDEAFFDHRFSTLKIAPEHGQPVVLGVPPWGERLREKLRESVNQSASQRDE